MASRLGFGFVLVILVAMGPLAGAVPSRDRQQAQPSKPDAGRLMKLGRFSDALAACEGDLAQQPYDPNYISDLVLKSQLLLLMNNPNQAFRSLMVDEYGHASPDMGRGKVIGEALRRMGDFSFAAKSYRTAGDEAKAVQMESFQGSPFETTPKDQTTKIPFLVTDPLPLVSVMANGVQANFIIDTGAGDVVLDPDFAAKIGVKATSTAQGTFAGGKKADQGLGELPELRLGSLSIRNVPVTLLNTKNFSAEKFGRPISGILGTNLFYHFLTTLDYPSGQLVLAPRGAATVGAGDVAIPFWLASDHLMVAWGRLGKSPDRLFLIDTGLAGAAFTGPKSITDEAGIAVSLDHAQVGEGGGGKILASAYEIPNISLGPVEEKGLIGVYGAFPDSFEESLGFHVGGIISHQFFRPYAVTFDFDSMKVVLRKR